LTPTWHNHTGNQTCHPKQILHRGSLQALVELVQRAEREKTTVRCVGAGHSWSDIALTDGYLVEPDRLSGILPLDDGTLSEEAPKRRLARVLGGTPLRVLNAALDCRGQALKNMGGYDAQTIAGVVSTSTHGSGLAVGPFPDVVRSLDLVVSGGRVLRIEPAQGGLTRAAAFEAKYGEGRQLIQDDHIFNAAICGLGTLGLIYSLIIEVREKFWLNEVRSLCTWEAVRDLLTPDGVLGEGDHYELFVNPYAGVDGQHRVLVTRRADCPEPDHLPPDKLERHPLTELESKSLLFGFILRFLARRFPSQIAKRFDSVLAGMVDDGYASVSYRVFNIGEANKLPAYSMELGVGLEDDRHLEAVDRILTIAAERREQEGLYHTSPFSLRFVAPSQALASMMYDQATMMIELIMVNGSRGGYELLAGYEERLADLSVRPHWGQINNLSEERVRELYLAWDQWKAVESKFNASNVFDSPFTERVGIAASGDGDR
jgi:hypothetical protein